LGEAVDYLVAYNEWFERKVRNSMAAAEESQTIPDEEVGARLERRERRWMRIEWPPHAVSDLKSISEYIEQDRNLEPANHMTIGASSQSHHGPNA
jgi:hypothetical protein